MTREQMIDEAVRRVFSFALRRRDDGQLVWGFPFALEVALRRAAQAAPLIRREFRRIQCEAQVPEGTREMTAICP